MLQPQGMARPTLSEAPPVVKDVLRSPGEPLDAPSRMFFEARFEHDFSKVRVHSNPRAAESARAVDALAYTVGSDIVFGSSYSAIPSYEGRKLLAHELAHVIQQDAETVPRGPILVDYESDAENEANHASKIALEGGLARVDRTGAARLSRKEATAMYDPATLSDGELVVQFETALAANDPALRPYINALEVEIASRFKVLASSGNLAEPVARITFPGITPGGGTAVGYLAPATPATEAAAEELATQAFLKTAPEIAPAIAPEVAPATTEVAEAAGVAGGFWLFVVLLVFIPTDSPLPKAQPAPKQKSLPRAPSEPRSDSPCIGEWVARRGSFPCHDEFAQALSNSTLEFRLTTPEGASVDYDALTGDQVLVEVKTGYQFLVQDPGPTVRKLRTIERWQDQSAMQLAVAAVCKYPLLWVFNSEEVRKEADRYLAVHTQHIPYKCDQNCCIHPSRGARTGEP